MCCYHGGIGIFLILIIIFKRIEYISQEVLFKSPYPMVQVLGQDVKETIPTQALEEAKVGVLSKFRDL